MAERWEEYPGVPPQFVKSIPLPPEPPRDRVVEAVGADGTVTERWRWDRDSWRCQGLYSRCPDGSWAFMEIAAEADSNGWSLRHVPAEGEEKP